MTLRSTGTAEKISVLIALVALRVSGAEAPPAAVPQALAVPPDQVLSVAARGVGVQVYACTADSGDPLRYAWVLKGPEAELRDSSGRVLGKHYAGPTWEANDGSKLVGELVARNAGPDAGAIPWLLLHAKSTSGTGIFAAILSVQRLHTTGGKAPVGGCDQAQAGTETRVAYAADYYFYSARP